MRLAAGVAVEWLGHNREPPKSTDIAVRRTLHSSIRGSSGSLIGNLGKLYCMIGMNLLVETTYVYYHFSFHKAS